ncbi:aminotransferase class V-fold PLP-dependent enzyme [Methanocorpusculum sp. MG]|uniref:Aminotransferase class V-fold PLP-dependent enzyme n=1 Tax=Methanocorpusculum petauri TaxID=3002863 RepID=A0ABT4IGW6_9EURY|nr:aminotransferase class V-fold PLP-dependent enzyme [Methanocorpusculum petauri]MCZ0860987.1 aminotransferase class V-fold PLP-dependent enzyme [Methanocorpusculum petauri]
MPPAPSLIYLNNAATSWPKPPEVTEAVAAALALPPFGSGRTTGTQGEDYILLARERLARLLGVPEPDHLSFTHNATDSLNILISGFLADRTDTPHVLTTALDHNSVLRPLHEYQRTGRIRLGILPFTNAYVTPETVEAAIQPDTKLMVMTHASNVLGSVQNIRAIGEILHDHGIYFIVDGAQTAGHIPITLPDLPVDAFVFTGHKGLLGIPGTGGFYLRDPETIEPVRFGGTGTNSISLFQPREMPDRFETGTHNYPGLAALAAGIAYLDQQGISTLAEQTGRRTAAIISGLADEETITIYNKTPDLPVIALNIQGLDNDSAGFILARAYNILVRTGLHCAPLVHKTIDGGEGCIRLSLSSFTTDEECQTTIHALREIAENANTAIHSA